MSSTRQGDYMHPLIGRLVQTVITIVTAITLGFVLIHQMPTGPWTILTALYSEQQLQAMDPSEIEELANQMIGFSATKPLHLQYIDYVSNILQGDFGRSVIYLRRPVFEIMAVAAPWTILLSTLSIVANTVIAWGFGAWMAYREGSRFDFVGTIVSVLLSSIPYYVFAIFMLIFLGFQTPFFPTGGRYADGTTFGFHLDFMLTVLHHAILPVATLVLTSFAALGLRAHCIRILGSDYIRVARLRGLAERRIVIHYLLRNSILPFYSGLIVGLVGIFGGSVITEQIFNYVGMGWYLFRGATGGDLPLTLGTFVLFSTASVVGLFFVDLTYQFVDPRAEGVGMDESF